MNAPRYFWLAATIVLAIVGVILFFSAFDFDDDDEVGAPTTIGVTL